MPSNASTNFNNKQKTTIFGVTYNHPSTNIKNFTDNFEQTLQKLQLQGCKFYICGDINIDYLKIHRDNKISQFANFLTSYNANNKLLWQHELIAAQQLWIIFIQMISQTVVTVLSLGLISMTIFHL